MRLRTTASLVGTGVLALALSACSAAGGKVGSPPPAPSEAHRGGVLKVGSTAPGGISPLEAYEPAGKLVSTALCDPLVAIDPVTGQLREALAKGWVVSDDNSITVKLRRGIRFTNGAELKATDVNYTLQQLVERANGAYAAGLAKQFVSAAADTQGQSLLADDDRADDIAFSVTKYDLQVFPRVKDGGALRTFAEPAMAPISRQAHQGDEDAFSGKPVCVGPYVLAKEYRSGDTELRLTRSRGYYGKNVGYTGGGKGYADEIVFKVFATAEAALAAYRAGQVDVVQVPRRLVASTEAASRVLGAATGVEYVGLPGASTGPFADVRVRSALSMALDRTRLAAAVFGPAVQPANGLVPPALAISAGRSLEGKEVKGAPLTSCGATTPAHPDLATAKALLAEAARQPGATPLRGFTLEVNDDAPYPAMARALAAQWKSGLGLDVKVVTTPWNAYVAKSGGSEGFTNAFRVRWSTDATAPATGYNSQQRFLSGVFGGAATNLANWAHYNDRVVEFGLTEAAAEVTDVQRRELAFAELTKRLCQQLPIIPLVFDRPAFLVRSTVVGSAREVPVGRDGVLLLRELYLR
jgi:ABC-type transport system substrate-binding protein